MAKKTRKSLFIGGKAKIDNSLKQYSNHPFFVKLHEQAMATYKKYGMPKEIEELIALNANK
jgi:hypothetical protein